MKIKKMDIDWISRNALHPIDLNYITRKHISLGRCQLYYIVCRNLRRPAIEQVDWQVQGLITQTVKESTALHLLEQHLRLFSEISPVQHSLQKPQGR
jgi:hypothetical protein